MPHFTFEETLFKQNFSLICGVDEAGRGPLAGPVVAAAVILNPSNIPDGLHDSKKLSAQKREALTKELFHIASIGIGFISPHRIDQINILQATFEAMRFAVKALPQKADYALIDGRDVPPDLLCPAKAIIKGDALSLSIAAASIIAKTMRDSFMVRLDKTYPHYGFAAHKGYGTDAHRAAIKKNNPSIHHRSSFKVRL